MYRSLFLVFSFIVFTCSLPSISGQAQNKNDPKQGDKKADPKSDPKKDAPKETPKADPKKDAQKKDTPKKDTPKSDTSGTPKDAPKTEPKPDPKKEADQKKESPAAAGTEQESNAADLTKPSSPIDLINGLRENDQTDLALEYLTYLEQKKLLPESLKKVYKLEYALTAIEVAKDESDTAKRNTLLDRSKADLMEFEKANANDPRSFEATVALAKLMSIQAKNGLIAALKTTQEGDKDKAAAIAVRPLFEDASAKFDDVAKKLTEQLDQANLEPKKKIQMTKDLFQAQLFAGINLYEKTRTYIRPKDNDASDRANVLEKAKAKFKSVGDRDLNNPYTWSAKAWSIECDYSAQKIGDAEKAAQELKADANKYPAAREGVRLVRFFEISRKYIDAKSVQEVASARTMAERWLSDYKSSRPTREQYSVQYYIAKLRYEEAFANGVKTKSDNGKVIVESVSAVSVNSFRVVERELRSLIDTENEYTERAAKDRAKAMRLIVGEKLKPAYEYRTFEEAQMAGLIELSEAIQGGEKVSPEEKKAKLNNAADYLQQAVSVATPQDSPKDILDARLQTTYAYLQSGQQQKAAVLGEYLSKNAKTPAEAAKAGVMAVQAYLSSAPSGGNDGGTDDESRKAIMVIDRQKAVTLAKELENKYPGEAATDGVRSMLGNQLYRSGEYKEAFEVLSRVSPKFSASASAKLIQGAAAFQLIRTTKDAVEKKKYLDRSVADLTAIAEPDVNAGMQDVRNYLFCQQQLVELYLLDQGQLSAASKVANDLKAKSQKFKNLPQPVKMIHAFDAERLSITATSTIATPLYNTGKWKELAEALEPSIKSLTAELEKNNSATKQVESSAELKKTDDPQTEAYLAELKLSAEKLDQIRRDRLLLIALQGKIRGGEADKTGSLIALMEKLGGNIDANATTLAQLLSVVKGQLAGLRKEQKNDEAYKMQNAVADLFVKFSEKPKLEPKHIYFSGKALNELGMGEKAASLLEKLPEAKPEALKAKTKDLSDEDRKAVGIHFSTKLELAKAYRIAGRYDDADKVFKAAMGEDRKSGWAAKNLEYRKEAIFLLEAKAASTKDPKKLNENWAIANKAWSDLAKEYYGALAQPLPKEEAKRDEMNRLKDQIRPIYFGIFIDNQRCLIKANTMVLKPDAMAKKYDNFANTVINVEKQNSNLSNDIREKFADFLSEYPIIKDKYIASGGKAFIRNPDGSLPILGDEK